MLFAGRKSIPTNVSLGFKPVTDGLLVIRPGVALSKLSRVFSLVKPTRPTAWTLLTVPKTITTAPLVARESFYKILITLTPDVGKGLKFTHSSLFGSPKHYLASMSVSINPKTSIEFLRGLKNRGVRFVYLDD